MTAGWLLVLWCGAAVCVVLGMYLGTRFSEISATAGWRAFRKSQATVTVLERQLDELHAELNSCTWRSREMSPN